MANGLLTNSWEYSRIQFLPNTLFIKDASASIRLCSNDEGCEICDPSGRQRNPLETGARPCPARTSMAIIPVTALSELIVDRSTTGNSLRSFHMGRLANMIGLPARRDIR